MPKNTATPVEAKATPATISVVALAEVPARTLGGTAKEKLAEFQAKQKVEREALAAPLIAGLVAGQALSDSVVYTTTALASGAANKAKRLVEHGLIEHNLRPAVRVTGVEPSCRWFLVPMPKAPEGAPNA